jgi:hypothetical protein
MYDECMKEIDSSTNGTKPSNNEVSNDYGVKHLKSKYADIIETLNNVTDWTNESPLESTYV